MRVMFPFQPFEYQMVFFHMYIKFYFKKGSLVTCLERYNHLRCAISIFWDLRNGSYDKLANFTFLLALIYGCTSTLCMYKVRKQ